jgi:O-antigen/teichoic acid export membrane protein
MSIKVKFENLRRNESYWKVILNTFWLFLDKFFVLGVAFFVGIYVARHLGPAQFGMLSYAMGFVGLFTAFTEMGLNNILVRDLVKGVHRREELLGSAFLLQTSGGIIAVIAILIAVVFNSGDKATDLLILIVASAELFKGLGIIGSYFQSQVQSKYIATASFYQNIFISSVKVCLVLAKAPVIFFALAITLDAFLGGISLLYFYTRHAGSILKWKVVKTLVKELFSNSWPLILYGLALNIQARIDQVMIGDMLGKNEVGYYSVALKLIETLGIVPVILASSLAPSITKAKVAGVTFYNNRLREYYRLMFIVFLVTSIPLFFSAEYMIVYFYGEAYRAAGILLSLFSLRMFFTCMGMAKSTYITNENLFRYTMITAIVGAISNVLINYLLIPIMGSKGAIIATIVSFTISTFVIDFFYSKTRENIILMLKSIFSFWKLDMQLTRGATKDNDNE